MCLPIRRSYPALCLNYWSWWNQESVKNFRPVLSPPSSTIVSRNPSLCDGNGRTGRALALWICTGAVLIRITFSPSTSSTGKTGPATTRRCKEVRRQGDNLTGWLEYTSEGLLLVLDRVWARIQNLSAQSRGQKIVLRPKQEQLLQMLRDRRP